MSKPESESSSVSCTESTAEAEDLHNFATNDRDEINAIAALTAEIEAEAMANAKVMSIRKTEISVKGSSVVRTENNDSAEFAAPTRDDTSVIAIVNVLNKAEAKAQRVYSVPSTTCVGAGETAVTDGETVVVDDPLIGDEERNNIVQCDAHEYRREKKVRRKKSRERR